MLSSVVKHLCIGVDESTHQHLVDSLDGIVIKGSSDQAILYQQILEQWPHSIVINSHEQIDYRPRSEHSQRAKP